jgi:hypothetical protein
MANLAKTLSFSLSSLEGATMLNQLHFGKTRRTFIHRLIGFALLLLMLMSMFLMNGPIVRANTEVGGPITADTTWTAANSPYIVTTSIDVQQGVVLTIEPGVTVKFDSETRLQVNGELIARGTKDDLIIFTSNQADPLPGDWGYIEFTDTAVTTAVDAEGNYLDGSILQYCVVEYAGYDTNSAIEVRSLLVDHCTVKNNKARGVYAEGSATDPSWITNNVVENNTVTEWLECGGGIYAENSIVSGNTVSNNSATGGGLGTYGGGICVVNSSTVSNNIVYANVVPYGEGGGIYASESTVINNTVSANSVTGDDGDGGGIFASGSVVEGNLISNNSAAGPTGDGGGIFSDYQTTVFSNTIADNYVAGENAQGAGAYSLGDFSYNTVVDNEASSNSIAGGVAFDKAFLAPSPEAHYNNFYDNGSYDVTIICSDDISGTNNYWGTGASDSILNQVYDWYDDNDRGKFLYVPYLQNPDSNAPLPPPTDLTADFQDDSANLSWTGLPSFTTGYGYKVYYDTDNAIPPYEGTGLPQGASPINVGDQTTYTLTGLDPSKDYYVAVTAYDNEGHESWYSNVEQKKGGYWIYLPLALRRY